MSERRDYFADVILPLALPNLYTYRIPQSMNGMILPGMRVVVQFGKNKLYSAIVQHVHEKAPAYAAKYVEQILDSEPIVTALQLKMWEWMASYYLCSRGEVMLAALPSGLRLSSETRVVLNPNFEGDKSHLDDEAYILLDALEVRRALNMDEISEILNRKQVYPLVRKLLDEQIILVYEEIQERYKPKTEHFIRLAENFSSDEQLRIVFDQLEKRAVKQLDLLMKYLQLSGQLGGNEQPVMRSALLKASGADSSILSSLIKKGILIQEQLEVSRLHHKNATIDQVLLSSHQQEAFDSIKKQFEEKAVVLLHGVTSSGKTEVYIRLIREQMDHGHQVLYLLPEIALTTQLITRLQKHFGAAVLVYHSKFNEQERVEVWNEVRKGYPCVVIGARSALFLPFQKTGLIIIDEEHDSSFKQQDPAPRYNARESAIWMAAHTGAKTLLGSATPSVESFYMARQGKYGFAKLTERYGGALLPEIEVIDIREATRKRMMKSHFSPPLIDAMEVTLKAGEQIILFQNRRGFAPSIECQTCGHIPHCVRCDVSMTYHKNVHQLRCHYCGYTTAPPSQCEACGSPELKMKGFGTEKIEEELSLIFPEAKIARMDLDTTRGKHSLQHLVNDFESGKINILVGTQMVTKGLDFENVSLVGILNADQLMNFPDFRAYERAYQLMAQVAGRAGRRAKQGKVIIQTFQPSHFVIKCVVENDYLTLYQSELADRMQFYYPPFFRLIRLTLKSKDHVLLDNGAGWLSEELKKYFGSRILGPEFPPVSRIRDEYLKNILIKVERESNNVRVKDTIAAVLNAFRIHADFKKIRVVPDVDPA
ncbi:MAG: primosomal protein N' [Bacteroidia bacterium]